MRNVWTLVLTTLLVAVVVHVASVWALPRVIMWRTIDRISAAGMNEIRFGKRPDATARGVVRPSPDLLYGTCPYDLSAGSLAVDAVVPKGTYWSVSMFDAATDNFYVKNDRQAKGGRVHIQLVRDPAPPMKGYEQVVSPTTRGLVLFRTLINDDKKLAEIDKSRRNARCRLVR